jgi:hypothetical protein
MAQHAKQGERSHIHGTESQTGTNNQPTTKQVLQIAQVTAHNLQLAVK